MKPKLLLGLALVLSSLVLFTGCRSIGTQRFTALAPTQASELGNSSRIVLDVLYQPQWAQADYNLWENLSMLAPMPKHWKLDSTLHVERVVKGDFDGQTIQLHWLHGLTQEQYHLLGVAPQPDGNLTNGTPLRIGFDSLSGQKLKNLKIMIRP